MNGKQLPVVIPPIYGYLCNAYPLSIALQSKKTEAWFYSNYIQLICVGNFPNGKFFTFYNSHHSIFEYFLSCPFIQFQKIHFGISEKYSGGIINFIVDAIEQNYYPLIYVDEYYIKHKSAYNNFHCPHEMLIFGYSENKLKVLGYDRCMQFGINEVDFSEFITAFNHCDKQAPFRKYIYLLEFNQEFNFEFDVRLVIQWLKEFRYGINSSTHFRAISPPKNKMIYGMAVYKHILEYLKYNIGEMGEKIDIRIFHTLWEHKKAMVLRIKYMINHKYLMDLEFLDKYTEIEKISLILRNSAIKYNMKNNPTTLKSMVDNMMKMEDLESEVLNELIIKLENK